MLLASTRRVAAVVALGLVASCGSGDDAAGGPTTSEPPASAIAGTTIATTPPATSQLQTTEPTTWSFQLVGPDRWEYDVTVTASYRLSFEKDVQTSRPGDAKLLVRVVVPGGLAVDAESAVAGRTAPTLRLWQVYAFYAMDQATADVAPAYYNPPGCGRVDVGYFGCSVTIDGQIGSVDPNSPYEGSESWKSEDLPEAVVDRWITSLGDQELAGVELVFFPSESITGCSAMLFTDGSVRSGNDDCQVAGAP